MRKALAARATNRRSSLFRESRKNDPAGHFDYSAAFVSLFSPHKAGTLGIRISCGLRAIAFNLFCDHSQHGTEFYRRTDAPQYIAIIASTAASDACKSLVPT
jgi:hypothetical protein